MQTPLRRAISEQEGPLAIPPVDVLVLTALKKELGAVLANSGPWSKERDSGAGFDFYVTKAYHGLTVAASVMAGMGPVSAALTTTAALTALTPKRVLLVGICAGISRQVRLGDVCVADQVVDYDLGKVERGEYAPRWRVFPADAELLRAAKMFQDDDWTKTILTSRPDDSTGRPNVHVGTVLAGSKVVADRRISESLRRTWTQAVGLEMEGGGTAAAAHEHPSHPTFLLIKGVCDRASGAKDDKWQNYAADAAGRYAISLLIDQASPSLSKAPEANREPRIDQLASLGVEPSQLRLMLNDGFSLIELRVLCQDLDVEWEDLPERGTRTGAAMDIIDTFRRRHQLPHLVAVIRERKPYLFE